MHFGENQLSPSLIGLSPLPTAHPPGFQPWWVRSSTRSYPRFNLAMGRSLGFGSRACDSKRPVRTRFRYGYPTRVNLATHRELAGSFFKRHAVTGVRRPRPPRLVGTRFQVLFHSPPGVLFTIPSRYSSAIGHQGVFRLDGWSRRIHTGFHGPRATRGHVREVRRFRLRGCYPLRRPIRMAFGWRRTFSLPGGSADPPGRPHNPNGATPAGCHTPLV